MDVEQYMNVKEAAKCWGLTERRVTGLCRENKIPGAVKQGKAWLIPQRAERPEDQRIKSGEYMKMSRPENLPLPIGISDYRLASTEYYYVDKTMLIKEFLDERPMVSLFTRPRRFGKTLNMDMLRVFFEKSEEDTSVYFRNKAIWSCGEWYRGFQGKYPVIFLTFKDVKFDTWDETFVKLREIITLECQRHGELLNSRKCLEYSKTYLKNVIAGHASQVEMASVLLHLSQMLDEHYGVAPIIIIDEYDTPIQQGHVKGFYDQVVGFMRNLFSGGLKDNRHLSYGFMTGILRVTKESIFSGLNNLKVNSILDKRYSEFFGFTSEEVKKMAQYYHAEDKFEEICDWYDGYRFGQTDIFNPWSVVNYFNNGCEPRAFWQSTGSNEVISEILQQADDEIYEKLQSMMQGEAILTYVDTDVIYPEIQKNPSSVYSFLLMAGYLKLVQSDIAYGGNFMCRVALPNKEIAYVYNKEVLRKLQDLMPQSTVMAIQEALFLKDAALLQSRLRKFLLETVSYHDALGESFYHGLMLGLCAMLEDQYIVSSNRESGEGRYDIQLRPRLNLQPGILIELKATKECSADKLKQLAEIALRQIDERKYDTEMRRHEVRTILKYGVAFCGKQVEIMTEEMR